MSEIKTIGVLTSGGDAPGMNAAIRAVVRSSLARSLKVLGIFNGYQGLMNGWGHMKELEVRSVSRILQIGGTILYTARSLEFKEPAGVDKAVNTCKEFKLDGIVVIGGDGSFRGARDLSLKGIPCVGIPATIDNDIGASEYSIGFDTAQNTAVQMVDRLRDTAASHSRASVVEVMGNKSGELALRVGLATGATTILVPEIEYDLQIDVIDRIKESIKKGRRHFIIIVAEGAVKSGSCEDIAKEIENGTGIETRATILGHVQRGGSPTCRDRVIAAQMGDKAVRLLSEGIGNRVIVLRDNKIVDMDIYEALNTKKELYVEMRNVAHMISG